MKNIFPNLLFFISVLMTMIILYMQFWGGDEYKEKTLTVATWNDHQENINRIKADVISIKQIINKNPNITGEQLKISSLETRVQDLEALFLNKAELAVTLPLVKKDIRIVERDIENINISISNTNAYLLALLVAVLAQLAGVALFIRQK